MTLLSLLPVVVRTPRLLSRAKTSRFLHRPDLSSSVAYTTSWLYPNDKYQYYSTTASNSLSSKDTFSGTDNNHNQHNPGLESVIGQGLASLTQTAKDVQSKTKRVKSIASQTTASGQKLASHKQLAESQRLLDVLTECLDALCDRNPDHPLVTMRGEPIAILDVQVNTNAKQAKVYWSLPYGILMDDRLTRTTYQQLLTRMETNLQQGGGASLLQKLVHTRLSFYYPPKLKFVPAPPKMVVEAVGDIAIEQEEEKEETKDS